MKTINLKILTTILTSSATSAFASVGSPEQSDNGMLVWGFIGFAAVILLTQAAPAVTMFVSMVKGLFFGTSSEASLPIVKGKNNK
ncbi:MAG: hypothetical protein J0665_07660 [Deltaproteobacteria bacterium]|nr:hypothetical protein [Deltaproteobacteria bacterium]